MESTVVENRSCDARYSFCAFLFSFVYYFYRRVWVIGVITFVLITVLPFQLYFAVSFFMSWVLWRMNCRGRCLGSRWKKWGIRVSCLSVVLCVVLKAWLYKFLSTI